MDTQHNLPVFSNKTNDKLLGSWSEAYPSESNENSGQTVDLAWVFAVFRRRALVMGSVAFILIIVSGFWLVWKKRQVIPVYQGSFKLLVEPLSAEGQFRDQFLLSQNKGVDIQRIQVEKTTLDYESQIRVLKSPQILMPVVEQIQFRYPNIDYNSLQGGVSISRLTYEKDAKQEGTKILEIRYQHKNTKQIEFVLYSLSKAYLQYSLKERQKSIQQGLEFIESQLPNLQQQVDTIQSKLQNLRQQYNLLNPSIADEALTGQAIFLRRERLETEAELAKTYSLYKTLQKQFSEADATAILSQESEAYSALIRELHTVEAEITSQSPLFRTDSPPMKIWRERQQNLQQLLQQESQDILENLVGEIEGIEKHYQTILQTENQVTQQLRQLPLVARQITDLERKLAVATDNLNDFIKKREALRLDGAQQELHWQLIYPPYVWRNAAGDLVPVEVTSVKRPFAIAVVLSVLLGIGVGFLIEILHTVFHTPEEIQRATQLPILGVIPLTKKLTQLRQKSPQLAQVSQVANGIQTSKPRRWLNNGEKTDPESMSPFIEAFRFVYTNICLLSSKQPIHSLAICSPISGDGKTTVALYLAKAAATIGKRVLLIDTNLRSPQLHIRLELSNERGLSEIIAADSTIQEAIQKSPLDENCFVLTAGQSLSDPIKLISSDKMQYLMEQFSSQFDFVIYDTPPLLGLGDSNLVAAQVDGTILVVGMEKTDRSLMMKALDRLKIARTYVLGFVANGMKDEFMNY
ncbi:capsular exopolysaccharide family protein [Coleofasciculus chthonoplastes PCC 7420]|uniref:non-specific protein-tyrosine kinase n=1 Tax=Coleofasciculus chthonoplastes PCC 7420 TaxID=118168 RepID=B4VTH4_9CYAN|nr:polysaccharide biosynthesis tyrosine autokinase [Coleofasciculus chthonoplastes]EDX74717.1 capsular exopolysaccharide family protein [Coleofasciculus chthonoplastes PCC 7420]